MIPQEDRISEIVYTRMTEQVVDGLPDILDYLKRLQEEGEALRETGRQEVLAEFDLQRFIPKEVAGPLAAVDSSSAVDRYRAVTIMLACSVRYGHADGSTPESATKMIPVQDSLYAMKLPLLLRLVMELDFLATSEDFTIMDNSFWSVLMEANQLSTQYGRSELPEEALPFVIAHLHDDQGSLIRTLRNPCVVAMSKDNVADAIARHLGKRVKDRMLMSLILEENELLRPLPIVSDKLTGRFGIERQLACYQEIEQIYKGELMVTYFKPWAHKPAYRLEFHDGIDLPDVLNRIKAVTNLPLILEPEPQFLADALVKSSN